MRAFPREVGVRRRDRLTCAAATNRAALVVLAVRTDRHERVGPRGAVGAVECDVQILPGIIDFAAVQHLTADVGVRNEPAPPWRAGAAAMLSDRRDAHLLRLHATDNGASELGIDD